MPQRATLYRRLARLSQTQPNAPFLTAVCNDDEVTISYGELDDAVRRIANWARKRYGLTSGRVAALRVWNDIASVTTLLGLMLTGSAVLILDPALPSERAKAQQGLVGADLCFHPSGRDAPCSSTPVPLACKLPEPDSGLPWPAGASPALIFATSGSTATSKLVVQAHANLVANAEAMRRHHGLAAGRRMLGCLPICHVNGLHFTLLATLASGSHAIMAESFDIFRYARWVEDYRPAVASVVPSILQALLHVWRQPRLPAGFSHFTSAAAPLNAATARALYTAFGRPVLQGYGLTETTNFSTTMPRNMPYPLYARLTTEADIPSAGVALYGNDIAVLTRDGEPAPPGEVGEVCMRGHNVMSGYARNKGANSWAFRNGWFHSEDLGYLRACEDGRSYLVLTGRIKNIAKVGGASVSLEEMERALTAHPAILDAVCTVASDSLHGERILATVVVSSPLADHEINDHLRRLFPPSVLPHQINRVAAVPRTRTGKILRNAPFPD